MFGKRVIRKDRNVCLEGFIGGQALVRYQAYISAVDQYPLYIVPLCDIWHYRISATGTVALPCVMRC
jgi:hypothetical protein